MTDVQRTHTFGQGPPPGPNGDQPAQAQPQAPPHPGMHVQPGPLSYVVAAKYVGGQKFVILQIEHATGMAVFVLPPEMAKSMSNALHQAGTGIEIAR